MSIPTATGHASSHIPPADVAAFIARHGRPYDPDTDDYHRSPFAEPVKAGKNTAIYNAHSYHTKVPPQGIVPYIQHYTDPGDIVLDPFCGSGMTGVAALMAGRHAILNDLSPAATHIAYNYCTPVDVVALKREFDRIRASVQAEFDWLYGTTCDRCGGPATIQYTIWSDVLECTRCRTPLVLWNLAVDENTGQVREEFVCTSCGKSQTKKGLQRVGAVPVITNYSCQKCKPSRQEHSADEKEIRLVSEIEGSPVPYWYPTDTFPLGRQTRKLREGTAQVSRVDEMFTRRNLRALARVWHEINNITDQILQSHLQFVFTSALANCSRMYKYRSDRKGGILAGTLYIPALNCEWNVLEMLGRKLLEVTSFDTRHACAIFLTASAADLKAISDASVDYIFTDPPFGENLQYAELNFFWEAWLQKFTDWSQDCVMNYVHNKGLDFYKDTMTHAFVEMCRVLKPNRWASVVFHNTDDKVWRAIQEGAQEAGFKVVNAMAFDKAQGTFNQVNMGKDNAAGFDVVLNLLKAHDLNANRRATITDDIEAKIAEVVAWYLSGSPVAEYRTTQYLHSFIIREFLTLNIVIEKVTIPYLDAVLPHYFKQIDGHWYLRREQVIGQQSFFIRTSDDATAWLSAALADQAKTTGELIPLWQMATLDARIEKSLDQILAENFWQDSATGRWRVPTSAEREKMSAQQEVADQVQVRRIQRFLDGKLDEAPTSAVLCGWVRFAYDHKLYREGVTLFARVNQAEVDPGLYRQTRQIAQACRMRAGETPSGQLSLF